MEFRLILDRAVEAQFNMNVADWNMVLVLIGDDVTTPLKAQLTTYYLLRVCNVVRRQLFADARRNATRLFRLQW